MIVGLKFVPPDPTQQERDREIGSDRGASKSKKNWSRGALHVLVKEARNLQTRAKNSGTCDPFCKRYFFPQKFVCLLRGKNDKYFWYVGTKWYARLTIVLTRLFGKKYIERTCNWFLIK